MAKKHTTKGGFALLEAVIFVVIISLLGSAMLAAAFNNYKNNVQRALNDRAYQAAVLALKMVGDEIATSSDLTFLDSFTDQPYTIKVDGTTHATVVVSSTKVGEITDPLPPFNKFTGVTLTAVCTIDDQTETVTLTLQRIEREAYPHTLFGAGFAGTLLTEDAALNFGPDTDLLLIKGSSDTLTLKSPTIGGNLVASGLALNVTDGAVGGTIVSNEPLHLMNTLVGVPISGDDIATPANDVRLAGVYTTDRLTIGGGSKIWGNLYAQTIAAIGKTALGKDLEHTGFNAFYKTGYSAPETVWDKNKNAHTTNEDGGDPAHLHDLVRSGLRFASGGSPQQLADSFTLDDPLAAPLRFFVPNFPADIPTVSITADDTRTPSEPINDTGVLYKVANNCTLTLNEAPGFNSTPAIFVQLGEHSTLVLNTAADYYLFVYGDEGGTSKVTAAGGSHIYGSMQQVSLEIEGPAPSLFIDYTAPLQAAYQLPASAGYAKTVWRNLGYTRVGAAS